MVDFLRIIGHGVNQLVEWVLPTPPPRPPSAFNPGPLNQDHYLPRPTPRFSIAPGNKPRNSIYRTLPELRAN